MKRVIILVAFTALIALIALPGGIGGAPGVARATTQQNVFWRVDYFNNPYLLDPPVLTRTEAGLLFNWGTGSPDAVVNADNFSARFATDFQFQPGTYRFYLKADDGVQLLTGPTASWGQPVIDTYNAPRPGELLTADVPFPDGGVQQVRISYREVTGDAYLFIGWEKLGGVTLGPNFPQPVALTNVWAAQYFNNPILSGAPTVTRNEVSPSNTWGAGSPDASVPADNFSARWTAFQSLNEGTYQVNVRADDGVRVVVDGVLLINEFHAYLNQSYSKTFKVPTGVHSIVIEYFEAGGDAFISFSLEQQPTSTPVITGPAVTVTAANTLNVRDAPSATTGTVVTRIKRGEIYAVVGRNLDSSWWQINVNGVIGWVSGKYVTASNTEGVPVTSNTTAPQIAPTRTPSPTRTPASSSSSSSLTVGQCPGFLPSRLTVGGYARVTPGLPNTLRTQPGLTATRIGQIPGSGIMRVLGGPVCNNSTAWWQVRYSGVIGWTAEGQGSTYWLEPYTP